MSLIKNALTVAIVASTVAFSASGQEAASAVGADDSPFDATAYERATRARSERIAKARAFFKGAKGKSSSNQPEMMLISLTKVVALREIERYVTVCACEVLQIHRTVGESQLAIDVSTRDIVSDQFRERTSREFISYLETRLLAVESEMKAYSAQAPELNWLAQKRAAFSDALIQARSGGMEVNGFLVRSKIQGVERLEGGLGPSLLAVEMVQGTRRPFAIPLEIYK